jgi:hypothetical protein
MHLSALDPKNPPETVRRCIAHCVSETIGQNEFFVLPERSRNHDDRRHFESFHPSIVKIMDASQNEDLKQAAAQCLAFTKQKFERRGLKSWLSKGIPESGLTKTQPKLTKYTTQ